MSATGVVGAGVIGMSVAQNLAERGHSVTLLDITDALLMKARRHIERSVRVAAMSSAQTATPVGELLSRIKYTTDYKQLSDCNVVVENATEIEAIKESIYMLLDDVCAPHTIYAANTSCIPIGRIGTWTSRADRLLGIHFMNPVPQKSVVEVVRGASTSDETMEKATQFLDSMGKTGIVVNDSPGFVSNRVLMLTINEAIWEAMDKVASPESIDRIFVECFGHRMGPLATADLIGLDTILHSLEILQQHLDGWKFRPCPLLRQMVVEGALGRKCGHGFFSYDV